MIETMDSEFEIKVQKEMERHFSDVCDELNKIGIKFSKPGSVRRELGGHNSDSYSTISDAQSEIYIQDEPSDLKFQTSSGSNVTIESTCPDDIYMKIISQFDKTGQYRRSSRELSRSKTTSTASTITEEKLTSQSTRSQTESMKNLSQITRPPSRATKSHIDTVQSSTNNPRSSRPPKAVRPAAPAAESKRSIDIYSAGQKGGGPCSKIWQCDPCSEDKGDIYEIRQQIIDIDADYKRCLNELQYTAKSMNYLRSEMEGKRCDIQRLMQNIKESKDCADESKKVQYRLQKELDCERANNEIAEKEKNAADQELSDAYLMEREAEDSYNRMKDRLDQEIRKGSSAQKQIFQNQEQVKNLETNYGCLKENLCCVIEKVNMQRCTNTQLQSALHELRVQCTQLQKMEMSLAEGMRSYAKAKSESEGRLNDLRMDNKTASKKVEEITFETKRESKRLNEKLLESQKMTKRLEKDIFEIEAKVCASTKSIEKMTEQICTLNDLEVNQGTEKEFLKSEVQRLKTEIVHLKNQLTTTRKSAQTLQSQAEALTNEIYTQKREIGNIREKISSDTDAYCMKKKLLEDKEAYERQTIKCIKDSIECKERVLQEYTCKHDGLLHESKCADKAIHTQEEHIKDMRMETQFQEKRTNALRSEVNDMENLLATLINDIDLRRQQAQRLHSNLEVVGFKEKETRCDISFVNQDIERVSQKLENDIQMILNARETLSAKWDSSIATLQNKEFALTCVCQEIENMSSQLKALKEANRGREFDMSNVKAAIMNIQAQLDKTKMSIHTLMEDQTLINHKLLHTAQTHKKLLMECEDLEGKTRRGLREYKEMRTILEEDIREQINSQNEINNELGRAYRKLQEEFNTRISIEREKMRLLQKKYDEKDAKLQRVVNTAKRASSIE